MLKTILHQPSNPAMLLQKSATSWTKWSLACNREIIYTQMQQD